MDMSKEITIEIECPSCSGTGIYMGMGEKEGASILCHTCKGTGKSTYTYNPFTGRKIHDRASRVYLRGYGYCISTGITQFKGVGPIDMSKEGVSYQEFLDGKMPTHIEKLACPMMTDQGACHDKKGFVNICEEKNGGWFSVLSSCKYQCKKGECWDRFHESGE
jgi:hypothetical protein